MSEQSNLRRRLLAAHPESGLTEWERLLLDTVVDGPLYDAEHRRNDLAARRLAFDPQASMVEELRLRLIGGRADRGALPFDLGESLLKPFQDLVSALSGGHPVPLEVVGISRGSTVLHVRPAGSPPESVGPVPVDSSPADSAISETVRLLGAVEGQGDLREFTSALLPAFKFVQVLDKSDLDLELTWSGASGDVREVELTARGRGYVAMLSETNEVKEPISISGRVTELRLSGVVKVKTGTSANSPAYEVHFVPAEGLVAMHWQLGDTVHFLAVKTTSRDRVGRALSERFEFLRLLSRGDMLDFQT